MANELKRTRLTELVRSDRVVVAVEVDAVVLPGDYEASLEPETVRFLEEVQRRADADDRAWLRGIGRVYVLETAA